MVDSTGGVPGLGEDCWKGGLDARVGCVSARTGISGKTPPHRKTSMAFHAFQKPLGNRVILPDFRALCRSLFKTVCGNLDECVGLHMSHAARSQLWVPSGNNSTYVRDTEFFWIFSCHGSGVAYYSCYRWSR